MAPIDPYIGKEFTLKNAYIIPAMKAGGICAASGLLVGGTVGIIRSPHPGLFAIASGIQCGFMGMTFFTFRTSFLRAMNVPLSSPPEERVLPSTLAGAFTGAAGGALRGRANIIPGIIMFSLFGYTGQRAYNFLDAPQPTPPPRAATADSPHPPSPDDDDDADQPLWKRVLNSKYSPMKVLSDEQYEHLLREKLVRVDAEIAIVDEQIGKVKARGGEDVGRGDREKA